MPTGHYKRTEFHRERLKGRGGWNLSEETKRKISLSQKGKKIPVHVGFQKGSKINVGKKYSKERIAKIIAKTTKPKAKITCLACNLDFERIPSLAYRKFCSKFCSSNYFKGEKSPNWTGGGASLKEQIKGSFNYKKWRFIILKRDDFTCKICNRKKEVNGKLEVDHHPQSFGAILVIHQIESLEDALRCKKLWDLENGRTVCKDCHKKTKNYGGKNAKHVRALKFFMTLPNENG